MSEDPRCEHGCPDCGIDPSVTTLARDAIADMTLRTIGAMGRTLEASERTIDVQGRAVERLRVWVACLTISQAATVTFIVDYVVRR